MDLQGGLMALANAGEGYLQGQRQRLQDKMNQLVMDSAQMSFRQKQNEMAMEQAESDYAMSHFTPTVQNPVDGSPVSGASTVSGTVGNDAGVQAQPQVPQLSPVEQMQQLASFDMQNGHPARAFGWQQKAAELAAKQADAKEAQLGTIIKLGTQGAQDASMFPEGQEGAGQFLAYELQSGVLTPAQYANMRLAVAQDPTTWKQRLTQHGITAAKQATLDLQKLQLARQQANDAQQHSDRMQSLAEITKYHESRIAGEARAAKGTGGNAVVSRDPSKWAQENTLPMIATFLQLPEDQVTTDSMGNASFVSQALNRLNQSIQVEATALVQNNKGITYPDAVKSILKELQKQGAFPKPGWAPTKMHRLTGGMDTGVQSVSPIGEDKDTAISFQQGETIIPGKVYKFPNGRYGKARANGTFDLLP